MTERPDEQAAKLHAEMIAQLDRRGYLADPLIAAAFRAVPRHHFLPKMPLDQIYADQAIALKHEDGSWISSSSQPTMMAIMLDQLAAGPGMRVLEVGTGSGYNAALISRIVGPAGLVISLELEPDLAAAASAALEPASYPQVEVRHADGASGCPDRAPFDRIIVTAGSWDLLPAWREQLAPGGRIVVPMSLLPGVMLSLALVHQAGAAWQALSAHPCGFVPLRGVEAHPAQGRAAPQVRVLASDRRSPAGPTRLVVEKEWCRIEARWPPSG